MDSRAKRTSERIKPNLLLNKPGNRHPERQRDLSRIVQQVSGRPKTRNHIFPLPFKLLYVEGTEQSDMGVRTALVLRVCICEFHNP